MTKRWETRPRVLRREVIDGVRRDGVDLGDWPDTREHGEATTGLAAFLERVEAANPIRVSTYLNTSDPSDVVWGCM